MSISDASTFRGEVGLRHDRRSSSSKLLAKSKSLDWRTIRKPLELQTALGLSTVELEKYASDTLHDAPYHLDEIAGLLEVPVDELISLSLRPSVNRGNSFRQESIDMIDSL